jgi:hypothetical protein
VSGSDYRLVQILRRAADWYRSWFHLALIGWLLLLLRLYERRKHRHLHVIEYHTFFKN